MITEDTYEQAVMAELEALGWRRVDPATIQDRQFSDPILPAEFITKLRELNPKARPEVIEEAVKEITEAKIGDLVTLNRDFTDKLQNGFSITYHEKGEARSEYIRLIDYEHYERNSFHVANQWTVVDKSEKRPDVVLFVNGLPLAVIELKSPKEQKITELDAFNQIKNYQTEIKSLFVYNQICAISDLAWSKAGTITSGFDRYMAWKSKDGKKIAKSAADFSTFFEGIFEPRRFVDIVGNFILFSDEPKGAVKILSGYHQYFAVKKAVDSTAAALKRGDGKAGVFWHTQGSGKSLSMVFYTRLCTKTLGSPTFVVLTDRNDLDNQLFSQFEKCRDFLRQRPEQAESRKDLKTLLKNRTANGIFFSTIQKFEEDDKPLSNRRDVIVMTDEAHRSQYGLAERLVKATNEKGEIIARRQVGAARIIRNSLPKAAYIGFTGTPISLKDRSTKEVFGEYIDIYDMTQAVEDGATRPVYYESRVMHLKLDHELLKKIDAEYERMEEAGEADVPTIEASKRTLSKMEELLAHDSAINSLVDDIIAHYKGSRKDILTGKAMIVAYSRKIAMKIYRRILEREPLWGDKVAVVMTESNQDPEEWKEVVGNKAKRDELALRFKRADSPLKIAIVVDMWLTGFDVPSLATMYVYKFMSGHNLMQAIARVNRVFGDKEGGLIVDYVGIAQALKAAMKEFSSKRDSQNYGGLDIEKTAYFRFVENLEVVRKVMHGFNYEKGITGTPLQIAKAIAGGVDFFLPYDEKGRKTDADIFIKHAGMMKQALSLAASIVEEKIRDEAAYLIAVRASLVKTIYGGGTGGKLSLPELNEYMLELMRQSLGSEGVTTVVGRRGEPLSLFEPAFLNKVAKLKEKNLAVEMLKKLLTAQIGEFKRTNIVQADKFSVMFESTMRDYLKGVLSNQAVIEELIKMAEEIKRAVKKGEAHGLTADELAFYDAITKPQAVHDFYTNDTLIKMTKELTKALRDNWSRDWQTRDNERARMRYMVKRLLSRYKYPPKAAEDALKSVIAQCELWNDNYVQDDYFQEESEYLMAASNTSGYQA